MEVSSKSDRDESDTGADAVPAEAEGPLQREQIEKPDGRQLILYTRRDGED